MPINIHLHLLINGLPLHKNIIIYLSNLYDLKFRIFHVLFFSFGPLSAIFLWMSEDIQWVSQHFQRRQPFTDWYLVIQSTINHIPTIVCLFSYIANWVWNHHWNMVKSWRWAGLGYKYLRKDFHFWSQEWIYKPEAIY